MGSTFLGLEIGRSGLISSQIQLNITGQNISNADTKGYSRQTVKTSPVEPAGGGYMVRQITSRSNVGQGVRVCSVMQIRSSYLDEQYRDQYADYCESEYLTQGLGYLEDLFNELDDKTSLTASLSSFFDALSDFADDPTSEAARTSVQQTAVTLTGNFNMIYNEMIDLYNDQNKSVKTVATQINELASEIAALNKTIGDYERSGQTANELRDRRNALVDKLSGYVDITCTEDATGMVTVQVAGETLVEGKIYNEIQITAQTDEMNSICGAIASFNDQITAAVAGGAPAEDIAALEAQRDALCSRLQVVAEGVGITIEADQTATVTFAGQDLVVGSTAAAVSADAVRAYAGADIKNILRLGETYLTTDTIQGGELRAHMRLRDDNTTEATGIPHYVDQLNKLARTIVKTMNECMNTGYTYPDEENGYSSVTGPDVDLFEDFGGDYDSVTAGNLAVSASVLASVWNLAGSSREIHLDAEDTQNSNNVVALRLAELINTGSFKSDLDSLISKLGLQVQSSKNRLDVRLALVESTQGQRESISGVSVDEEAINLIKFEQTYGACARVITAMDEVLDRLINGTGRVGL